MFIAISFMIADGQLRCPCMGESLNYGISILWNTTLQLKRNNYTTTWMDPLSKKVKRETQF